MIIRIIPSNQVDALNTYNNNPLNSGNIQDVTETTLSCSDDNLMTIEQNTNSNIDLPLNNSNLVDINLSESEISMHTFPLMDV